MLIPVTYISISIVFLMPQHIGCKIKTISSLEIMFFISITKLIIAFNIPIQFYCSIPPTVLEWQAKKVLLESG